MPNGTAEGSQEPMALRETGDESASDSQPPDEEVKTGAREPTRGEESATASRQQIGEGENSSSQPVAGGENAEISTQQPIRAVEKAANDQVQIRGSDAGHQQGDEKLQADQPQPR